MKVLFIVNDPPYGTERVKRLRRVANQTQITGVHDHRSGYLHLPSLMFAARNLFELVPVLLEASEIAVLLRSRRLDFFERAARYQNAYEPSATQHSEPHAPDGLVRWVRHR